MEAGTLCADVGYLCCYHETSDVKNWELYEKPSPGSTFTTNIPSTLGTWRQLYHVTDMFPRILQYRLNLAQLDGVEDITPDNWTDWFNVCVAYCDTHLHDLQQTHDAPPHVRLTGSSIVHMSGRHGVVDRCARAVVNKLRFISQDCQNVYCPSIMQHEYWSNLVCSALSMAGVHMFIEEITHEQTWLTIININALALEVVWFRSPSSLSGYDIRTQFQMYPEMRLPAFTTIVRRHNKLYPDMPAYILAPVCTHSIVGVSPIYTPRLRIL